MTEAFTQSPEELEQFLDFIENDLENIRRVINWCQREDLDVDFMVHAKSETAEESAENVGIETEKIVKTLVFKAGEEFVAVLCPGDERVSEGKLEDKLGSDIRMANPSEVEEQTGYVVGGVSPFDLDIQVLMEKTILENQAVKPAAGSRVVGVTLDPEELRETVAAETADLV
ncbi:MAG: Cys-tRNA(Pro) deacylase [Candidatus Nanohaloarchaea archaeon]|jgi:Cys-tRNA(Pro) deacylase